MSTPNDGIPYTGNPATWPDVDSPASLFRRAMELEYERGVRDGQQGHLTPSESNREAEVTLKAGTRIYEDSLPDGSSWHTSGGTMTYRDGHLYFQPNGDVIT